MAISALTKNGTKTEISNFTFFQNLLKISKNLASALDFHPILRIFVKFYHLSLFFEKKIFSLSFIDRESEKRPYFIHFHSEFKELSSNLHRSY